MSWKILVLQVFNGVLGVVETVQHIYRKLSNAFDVVFLPSYYVFFKDIPYPHPMQFVQLWASASAKPELLFNADAKTFFPACGLTFDEIQQGGNQVCLPYLSLEVIDDQDRPHYDLTDFIEKIRVVKMEEYPMPSLFHVMAVWSLYSHIVIDPTRFRLRTIDGMGETHVEAFPVLPSVATLKSLDTILPADTEETQSESSETETTAADAPAPAAAETT